MTEADDIPVASASTVFREELDDWALLFDPDTGEVHGLNPVATFIWKQLDGRHSVDEIASLVQASFDDVPDSVVQDTITFIDKLKAMGYAGHEVR